MTNETSNIIWLAPCGSWGGCAREDLVMIEEALLTDEERDAISYAEDVKDAERAIIAAYNRIHLNDQ